MKIRVPSFLTRGALGRLSEYLGRPSAFGLKGYRSGVVLALFVVILVGSGTKAVMHAAEALPEGAAYRAQGVVVTEEQLRQRVSLMEFVYGLQQPKEPAKQDEFKRSVAKAMAVSDVVDSRFCSTWTSLARSPTQRRSPSPTSASISSE